MKLDKEQRILESLRDDNKRMVEDRNKSILRSGVLEFEINYYKE